MGIALPTQGFMNLSGDVFEGFNNRNKGSSSKGSSTKGSSSSTKGSSSSTKGSSSSTKGSNSSNKGSSSGGSGNNKGNSNNSSGNSNSGGSNSENNNSNNNNNSSGGGSSNNDNNNNKVRFGSNVDNHLKNVEEVTGKKIIGGHNLKELKKTLNNLHPDIKFEDFIIDMKPHPTIEGIYEVKYQLPRRKFGGIIEEPVVFREIQHPKTVYDPSKISDEQIAAWGREAMENGIRNGNITNARVEGFASNGLKFEGYLRNGEITNFYPVIE